MDRKTFLRRCAALAAGIACVDLAGAGCAPLPYVDYVLDDEHLVVRKDRFGEAGFVLLEVASLPAPVYVARADADRFTAVLLRCTHRGCKVQPAGDRLECPCHGSQYSPAGDVTRGPAPRNLHRYAVTTDDEHVRIALS